MNLEKSRKISIIVIPVILISVILIFVLILTSERKNQPQQKEKPISSQQVLTQKADLIRLMPVKEKGFIIEYLKTLDKFVVTITDAPYKENQQNAEAWFTEKGFTSLEQLGVIFHTPLDD